jgi:K(+)-stimulated pyrophosphate-energized sodium pump
VMNLVSLLMLPAIISLQDNDAARYAIAGAALVVLLIAIAFSKRKTEGMMSDADMEAAIAADSAQASAVMNGDPDAVLAQAIDQWLADLGHEEHDLRARLLEVKSTLQSA